MTVQTANTADAFATAAERAYGVIRDNILSGQIPPGTKLSRRKLATMAGVSVIPVTEAVRRLEEDGLLESRAHCGTRIVPVNPERARDWQALREAVECQVARMLAGRLSPQQEEQVRALAHEIDAAVNPAEVTPATWERHHRFHMLLAEYTGCVSFVDALRRANLFRMLQNAVSRRRTGRRPLPPDWHTRIVDAIMSGDPAKSEMVMREHVNDSFVADADASHG